VPPTTRNTYESSDAKKVSLPDFMAQTTDAANQDGGLSAMLMAVIVQRHG